MEMNTLLLMLLSEKYHNNIPLTKINAKLEIDQDVILKPYLTYDVNNFDFEFVFIERDGMNAHAHVLDFDIVEELFFEEFPLKGGEF